MRRDTHRKQQSTHGTAAATRVAHAASSRGVKHPAHPPTARSMLPYPLHSTPAAERHGMAATRRQHVCTSSYGTVHALQHTCMTCTHHGGHDARPLPRGVDVLEAPLGIALPPLEVGVDGGVEAGGSVAGTGGRTMGGTRRGSPVARRPAPCTPTPSRVRRRAGAHGGAAGDRWQPTRTGSQCVAAALTCGVWVCGCVGVWVCGCRNCGKCSSR